MADEPTTPQSPETPQQTPAPETPQEPAAPEAPENEPFFVANSEDELNAKLAEERSRILSDLGYEDMDALKADTEATRQQREAARTDLERAQEAQSTLQTENDSLYERVFEAEVGLALRDAGVPKETAGDVSRLLDMEKVDVDDEGNITGLDEQLSALRERIPGLFGGTVQQRTAPDTTPRQTTPTDWWSLSPEEFQKQQEQVLNGGNILPR